MDYSILKVGKKKTKLFLITDFDSVCISTEPTPRTLGLVYNLEMNYLES